MRMGWSVLALASMIVLMSATLVHPLTCNEAVRLLMPPCKPYLVDDAPKPTDRCCFGVVLIRQHTTTKENRKYFCECFKKAGKEMGVKGDKAGLLSAYCDLPLRFPFGPDADCTKVADWNGNNNKFD